MIKIPTRTVGRGVPAAAQSLWPGDTSTPYQVCGMKQNADDVFRRECPELAERFGNLIEVQRTLAGIDQRTKQLINIAVSTAGRDPGSVHWHAILASRAGADKDEIVGAVVMNLHRSGLVAVLESIPAALAGIDEAKKKVRRG
jgi:AhpD family alkylhydroperoxidase